MRHRLGALVALFVLALAVTGSAFAFDCIRVSSSLQGLKISSKSGNWALFDLSSGASAKETLQVVGVDLTDSQAQCVSEHYRASGRSPTSPWASASPGPTAFWRATIRTSRCSPT
jgi:hypothetical protein